MADNPVGVVRSTYDAFARGDIPAVLSMMDGEVEWVESSAEGIPTRGVHRGPKQVAENVFGTVVRDWSEFTILPEDFFSDGQTVIVRGRVNAVAKGTGYSMDAPFVHIFTVTDGKLAKLTNHHDTALWLQALGK